jgi:hypothetical protein
MLKRLAEFRPVQLRRIAPGPCQALTHRNDNLPGRRRPATAGKRRSPTLALACHWFDRDGRLECRWQGESGDDATSADGEHRMAGGGSLGGRGRNQALAVGS